MACFSYQSLAGLSALEVPAGDFEPVKPKKKAALAEQSQQARAEVDDLIRRLRQKEYVKAAGYLETARARMFQWLEFWLETGLVTSATTGYLERLMRELGRRLKKIGFGWTDTGAAQMARILSRRITDPVEGAAYCKKRLRLDGRSRAACNLSLSITNHFTGMPAHHHKVQLGREMTKPEHFKGIRPFTYEGRPGITTSNPCDTVG